MECKVCPKKTKKYYTEEGFKRRFKVGDAIRGQQWAPWSYGTITAIGQKRFLYLKRFSTGKEREYVATIRNTYWEKVIL